MVRPQVLQDANYNPFIFTMIIIAGITILAGVFVRLDAGSIYFNLTLFCITVLVLAMFFFKEETTKQLYKSPLLSSFKVAIFMYLLGYVIILLMQLVGNITKAFSVSQFFSPLYLSGSGFGSGISATYLASAIETSVGSKLLYGVFIAGTIEEFAFGFIAYLAGWIISLTLLKFFDDKAPFGLSNKAFSKIVTYAFVIFMFMLIHKLNSSYEGIMFIWAGAFRALMTVFLYEFGWGLSFTTGMHHANNFLAFLYYEGVNGLTNFIGVTFVIVLLGLLAYTVRNLTNKQFNKELKKDIGGYRVGG